MKLQSNSIRIASLSFLAAALACSELARVDSAASGLLSISVTPSSVATNPGGVVPFSAIVSGPDGSSASANWSVLETGGGTVDANGVYHAPDAVGTYTVVASSVGDSSVTAQASVIVTADPVVSVAVSPLAATAAKGGTAQFAAGVTGTTAAQSTAVTWSVKEAAGGSIDASGLYHATGSTGAFTVVATSVAAPTVAGSATVTVVAAPAITVSVSPNPATVAAAGSLSFSASVANVPSGQSSAVTWSVVESGGGSISAAGVYTAPAAAGTYHVKATSVADGSRSAQATVVVTASGLTQAQKVALVATKRWIFYHMSTGCNLTGGAWSGVPTNELVHDMVFGGSQPVGLYKTVKDAGGGLRVVHPPYMSNLNAVPDDSPDSSGTGAGAGQFTAGTFWHNHVIGANESVGNKIAAFDQHIRAYLGAKGSAQALARVSAANPIYAGVKFCWVDDWTSDIVTRLFSTYQLTMAALEADYPGLHIIHFAAPLQPTDTARNGYRTSWSNQLRTTYPGLVFNVDQVEATRQDGSSYVYGGQPALSPEWSGDAPNGHLSEAGADWVGSKLLDFLAAVAQR